LADPPPNLGRPTAENKEQNVEHTEQVANPPQPAATTPASSAATSELERHSSFLGVRPAIEVTAEDPETSAAAETDGTDGQPEAAPASAEGDEQDVPNWLPDEQQKVFTDDAIARYAKRYGYTQEQIEQNPQLRQLLHDKINSDIFLAKMRDGQSEDGEEPTLKTDEAEAGAPQTQTDPAEQALSVDVALAHSFRLPRKRLVQIGGTSQLGADRLCAMDGTHAKRFPLALIHKPLAVATGECSTTQVQNRHAPSAASCGAKEPSPRSTVTAWCPFKTDSVFQVR
jgi:hypothetical protein